MSTPATTIDPSRRLDFYFRVKRAGTKKFIFQTSAGVAIDISAYAFALYIKKYAGDKSNTLALTIGSGLAVGGSGNNELTATFTVANTNVNEGEYYYELYKGSTDKTYLNGKAIGHNGFFDGVSNDSSTVTVTDASDTVTITISDSQTAAGIAATLGYVPDNVKGVTASGTDTYTATYTPAPTAYATGQRFTVIFTNANTGAATLNLNSLGAKSIKKDVSSALAAGDIAAGEAVDLVYDGTNFQMVSGGGGATVTASNGLTKTSNDIALGGALTGDTTLSGTSLIGIGATAEAGSKLLVQGPGIGSNAILNLRNSAGTPQHLFRENGNATIGSFTFNNSGSISNPAATIQIAAAGGSGFNITSSGFISGEVTNDGTTGMSYGIDLAPFVDRGIPDYAAVKAYADAKVADAINNGTTTIAPSQNAVFDALALKVPTSTTVNGQALSANIDIPNHSLYYRSGQSRFYFGSVNASTLATSALGANTIKAVPLVVSKSITILEIVGHVSTAVGGTNFRCAIYQDDGNGYPGSIVTGSDAAEHSSATTGIKTSGAVSITLTPGLYWIAYNSNGAPTLYAITAAAAFAPVLGISSAIGGSNFSNGYSVAQAYGAMPATFTAGGSGSTGVSAVVAFKV